MWLAQYVYGKGLVTVVLYRCRSCGDVRTKTLDGHWTLDQIKGTQVIRVTT